MARRDQAAAEELEQFLSAGVPADEAGAHAALVGLATAVREHTDVPAPDPGFRASLRETLLNAPPPAPIPPTGLERLTQRVSDLASRIGQSGNTMVATAATAGLIGSTGLVIAAQDALPGDALRPVRNVTESVRLGLASDLVDRGLLELQFATAHLDDLVAELDGLTAEQVDALLARIDELALAGTANVLLGAVESGAEDLLVEAVAFVDATTVQLRTLLGDLDPGAATLALATIDALDEVDGRLERATITEVVVDDPDHAPGDGVSDPDGDGPLPTDAPTSAPTVTDGPTQLPSGSPTDATDGATELPTVEPSVLPTDLPTDVLPSDVAPDLPLDEGTDLVDPDVATDAVTAPESPSLDDVIEDVVDDVLGG